MKVKILTEGGKKIGLGHLTRCSSLYDELMDREISVTLFVSGYIENVKFVKNYSIINDNWQDTSYLEDNITKNDYVIIDSYRAKQEHYNIIAKNAKEVLYIDDNNRLIYPKGIILNPSLDSSYVNYHGVPKSHLLTGPDYVILRTPFKYSTRNYISNKITRVLIIIGGSDIRNLIPVIIQNICIKKENVIFDVIVNPQVIEKYQDYYINIKNINFYSNVDASRMCNLMINTDLAITGAGQTIYELIATRTPFIAIQVIDNQRNNVRSLLKYNSNQIIINYVDEDFNDKLCNAFEKAQAWEFRKNQFMNFKNLIDGYGAKRSINHLIDYKDCGCET